MGYEELVQKLKKYKYIIIIMLLVFSTIFYWYEWRPTRIKKECYAMSGEKARELLKIKADLSGGYGYKEAVEKGLFLKDDFESIYKNCLRKNGL